MLSAIRISSVLKAVSLIIASMVLSACSTVVYKPASWFVYDYAEHHALSHVLTIDDVTMACAMTQSSTELLMSFSSVGDSPDKLAAGLYMLAGSCAENEAHRLGLEYLKAYQRQDGKNAKDLRIQEKRAYELATRRYLQAYHFALDAFGDVDECVDLSEHDEFFYLVGMLSGIKATMSDVKAQGQVGVAQNIPAKAARAISCLDNERWWRVPKSVELASDIMLRKGKQGRDLWAELSQQSKAASDSGVRLAHVIEVMVADSFGRQERVRRVIKEHAQARKKTPSNQQYRAIDAFATQQIQMISDRIWIEKTGARTPFAQLGKLPASSKPKPKQRADTIDTILNNEVTF